MQRYPVKYVLAVGLALSVFFPNLAVAQTRSQPAKSISGTVKDSTGQAIPFATISAKNEAGATSEAHSDTLGRFTISNLAPGEYEVSISASGFAAQTTKVTVDGATPPPLNIQMSAEGGLSLSDLGFSSSQTQGNAAEQARLDKRSHMLKVHQRFGVITTVPLVATVLTGLKAGGRQTSSTDRDVHAALGSTTAVLYGVTAYYAIFAPKIPGTETRGPIKAHKILAWIHGPGMVLTPILGAMAFSEKSKGERVHGIASLHGPVAVITAGAYGAAILSVSLKW